MDRVILKGNRVRHEESSHVRHAAAVARGDAPEVRLVELDGVVRALEVRCSCGDTITVELDVPADSQSGARASITAEHGSHPGPGGAA